jgi:hypothetical protein
MTEIAPASSSKIEISFGDRLYIIQTMNALPSQQFDELVFALNPPKGIIPPRSAPQGDRSKDLLDWASSPTGPGLGAIDKVLHSIIPIASKTAPQFTAFAISGQLGDLSPRELAAIVQLLRKKTGDNSIDIAFFGEGSIKLVLSGSPDGLENLKSLFEVGDLDEALNPSSIEYVYLIDSDTTEARKANLIQALKLRKLPGKQQTLILALILTTVLVKSLTKILQKSQDDTLNKLLNAALDNAQSLCELLTRMFFIADVKALNQILISNVNSALNCARELDIKTARNIRYLSSLAYDINRLCSFDLGIDPDAINDLYQDIARDLSRVKSLNPDFNFDFNNALKVGYHMANKVIDLSGLDLSGANLQGVNLVGIPLIETNFDNAIVQGAIFGNNPGLTDSDKDNLRRRGAIFQDLSG